MQSANLITAFSSKMMQIKHRIVETQHKKMKFCGRIFVLRHFDMRAQQPTISFHTEMISA